MLLFLTREKQEKKSSNREKIESAVSNGEYCQS